MKITTTFLLASLTGLTLSFYASCRHIMTGISEDTLDYFLLNKHSLLFLWIAAAAFILLCVINKGIIKKNA